MAAAEDARTSDEPIPGPVHVQNSAKRVKTESPSIPFQALQVHQVVASHLRLDHQAGQHDHSSSAASASDQVKAFALAGARLAHRSQAQQRRLAVAVVGRGKPYRERYS